MLRNTIRCLCTNVINLAKLAIACACQSWSHGEHHPRVLKIVSRYLKLGIGETLEQTAFVKIV